MYRKTVPVFLVVCSLLLFACDGRILIATYNVENLFDDHSDGREYPEYSGKRWSPEAYHRKLLAIARAVRAISPRGPDIICFQEIESARALRELRDEHLPRCGYRYLLFVPQEHAATTVACLSRIPISASRVHQVGSYAGEPLRHILEVHFEKTGSILYVFINHWKSKSGGVESTAYARAQAAGTLTARIREILRADPEADLVVLGDLNENIDEFEQSDGRYRTATVPEGLSERGFDADTLFITPQPQRSGFRGDRVVLYDPWYELPHDQRGSSVYRGSWQTPDRILLSAGLFDQREFSYSPGNFRAVRAGFLLDPRTGFPRRWRHDSSGAAGGTSDHLPLRLIIRSR
jgi:endonuclease/exonuclease/phosphatase family metal-dependent hydrolase